MNPQPDDSHAWTGSDADADRALADLHRGIERARQQVRTYREVLKRDPDHDS